MYYFLKILAEPALQERLGGLGGMHSAVEQFLTLDELGMKQKLSESVLTCL